MGGALRVFLSYSHDSEAHRQRVLGLSERLRADGFETILDQYVNGSPAEGWPRWMMDRLDESDRVLLICTPTYYRRFRGHEEPGKGKGVDWEGAIITQEMHDSRSRTTRFLPVLFDPTDEPAIPEPLRGQSFHCLTSEEAYQTLCDVLLGQAGVEPGPVGAIKAKPRRQGEPMTFPGGAEPPQEHDRQPPRIDLDHLPAGAEHFLGRGPELAALETAWTRPGTALVELIAPGGTGKTALVKQWLQGLRAKGWGGAAQVYGWSFYSQGTGEDRQASEDHFLAAAIQWFGVDIAASANPADKGRALAERIQASRTLLILDGLEPLQYPPGPLAGELRAPGLQALLTRLASAGQPGLCLLTSREWIQDLAEWVRNDTHADRPVLRLDLGNLSDTDGACLLHRLGAKRAGAAAIGPDDGELMEASRAAHGHALTLSLLGHYLRLAHAGDIRQRDRVDFADANQTSGGHAFRVMAAYERWLAGGGEDGARCLAVLRLLGFFDRPASAGALQALRTTPPIPGLTEPLFALPKGGPDSSVPPAEPISDTQWRIAESRLADAGLIERPGEDGALDAHPLVREHLARRLKTRHADAWREGHRRLYEKLKEDTKPHRPEGLAGLRPLYQAVSHGCRAGLWEDALYEVYVSRILRGTEYDGFYSWRKLGAFGDNLGAVRCFFAEPWSRPAPALKASDQAWLLGDAAIQLRGLGRLAEALEPMRAGAEMAVQRKDWKNAAIRYSNLSELQLTLGRIPEAVADACRSVEHADHSGDAFWRIVSRTTLTDSLHQQGQTSEALATFTQAERIQAEDQPEHPLLYSLRGFQYCDLLLAGAERGAWTAASGREKGSAEAEAGWIAACEEVAGRARQALKIAESNNWLLDIALDHLTLARCALCTDRLQGCPPGPDARQHTESALDRLRAAGQQQYVPLGLLTRAWLRHTLGEPEAARADLDEAQRIATRGGMALFLADIALTRARLFHDRTALAQARALIEKHGYNRRLPELQDAEAAAAGWPAEPETRAYVTLGGAVPESESDADSSARHNSILDLFSCVFLGDDSQTRAMLSRLGEAPIILLGRRDRWVEECRLVDEPIRLDVHRPRHTFVDDPFDLAVVVRHPGSPQAPIVNLPVVESAPGRVFRPEDRDWVRYRIRVQCPSECKVEPAEYSILLRPQVDAEPVYFKITCHIEGLQSLFVIAYQDDDTVAAQTRVVISAALNVELQAAVSEAVDFIFLAPLPEERDALLARLPGHRKLPPSEDDIRVYYAAEVPACFPDGQRVIYSVVVLPLSRMGHTEAANAAGDAIRRFRPRYVLLVGIAGGIAAAGVGLGDVLLSDQVADYELAKVTPEGPSIRWQVHRVDQRLLIAAQNHDGGAFADGAAGRPGPGQPRVHIGPICTGNKVIADDSLANQLREVWVKLIGVEMEAGGVANAASQSARQPGFFMVRGVSDLADADKDREEVTRWRPYACDVAAAWTVEWLKSGPVPAGKPASAPGGNPAPAPSPGKPQGGQASQSTPTPGPAPALSAAAAIWQEKLDYLRGQEAICSDPAQRFTLKKQIEEAEAMLRKRS